MSTASGWFFLALHSVGITIDPRAAWPRRRSYRIGRTGSSHLRANLAARLNSEAWTSHRAYIGRDSAPGWLRTEVFLGLLGGPEKLNVFVRSVHTRNIEYPEDFDPESGLCDFSGS